MDKVKEKINKKENKTGVKLFLVLFFIIYFCLELGFSGLYTYTTIGVLYTCLMYFSIFMLFACVYMFFKFRNKNDVSDKFINKVLMKCFIDVTVIIIIFTLTNIYSYVNNMNGVLREKDNYLKHSNKLQTTIENEINSDKIENTINVEENKNNGVQSIYENMLEYKENSEEFEEIYNAMNDKLPVYIGLRILTGIIDIGLTAGVLFIVCKKMIIKIVTRNKEKEENNNINTNENENKIQKEEE